MNENIREVVISLDSDSMVVEFDQGDLDEDTFFSHVIDYVLTYLQIEII